MEEVIIRFNNKRSKSLAISEECRFTTSSKGVIEAALHWCVVNNATMETRSLPPEIDMAVTAWTALNEAANREK